MPLITSEESKANRRYCRGFSQKTISAADIIVYVVLISWIPGAM